MQGYAWKPSRALLFREEANQFSEKEVNEMSIAIFKVGGMKCGGCEKTVQSAADAVEGVLSSKASSSEGTMTVEFDDSRTSESEIKAAVSAKGYPAS